MIGAEIVPEAIADAKKMRHATAWQMRNFSAVMQRKRRQSWHPVDCGLM